MSHVEELLQLRDGTPEGEARYRTQVLLLIGAEFLPDLTLPGKERRAEGSLTLRDANGLVMFAVGDGGKGVLSDVRSKSAGTSARSLLNGDGTEFVILVTTDHPSQKLLIAAEEKSGGWLPGLNRPRIWVIGLPEIVTRAERYTELPPPLTGWQRFKQKFRRDQPAQPIHPENPLLLD